MADIDLFALTANTDIQGDNSAGFTITIGQQVTFSDSVALDIAFTNFTVNGQRVAFKNNYAAAVNPTATDDAAAGYEVGSIWFNTTSNTVHHCVDATGAAAIWVTAGVDTTGTPVAGQVAFWSDANTLQGDADLDFDGSLLTVLNVSITGTLVVAGASTFSGGAISTPGGSNNEAWGDGTLIALTTAGQCTGVGVDVLANLTEGSNNLGAGFNAGAGIIVGTSNMCIGPNTLTRGDTTECVGVGVDACRELNTAAKGIGIGFRAAKGDNTVGGTGTNFVAIGNTVGQVYTTANNWVGIGTGVLVTLTTGDDNTVVGALAGGALTVEVGNTLIGKSAGDVLTGANNTLLGANVGSTLTSTSDELRIHNDNGVAIISGDMSTNQLSVNNHTRAEKFNITVDDTQALECLALDQDDLSEGFINFLGTSAASAANPVSSLTTPGVPAGFVRGEVNSVDQWLQVFDDPSTPELTLGAADDTFVVNGSYMEITGDGGANTVVTVTGGVKGMLLTLKFVDALVTITDTAATTVDTVNLSAAFTGTADDTMQLIHDGNKWFEVSRSVN